MNRKKVLFAGCLITYRFPEYELSAKLVLNALNIQTETLAETICCGSVIQGVTKNWIYMAAYDLALAEQHNMDLITLCGGCTNTFKRLQSMCNQSPKLLAEINSMLTKVGMQFHNTVKVMHLIEVLNENMTDLLLLLKTTIPLNIAVVNPCQVFRPDAIMQFDNASHPRVMHNLLNSAVSTIIPYSLEDNCCGSSLGLSDVSAASKIGAARLHELESKDADVIITACGNCHLLLHCMQSEYHKGRRIPCLFISQLLGLAMGLSPENVMIYDPLIRSKLNG